MAMLTFGEEPRRSTSERWNAICEQWDHAIEQLEQRPNEWAYVSDVARRDFERLKARYGDRPVQFRGQGCKSREDDGTPRQIYDKVWVRWSQ